MKQAPSPWMLRRVVVRSATRKLNDGVGARRPEPNETPLSPDEIFFGVCRGLIRVPPLGRTREVPEC